MAADSVMEMQPFLDTVLYRMLTIKDYPFEQSFRDPPGILLSELPR